LAVAASYGIQASRAAHVDSGSGDRVCPLVDVRGRIGNGNGGVVVVGVVVAVTTLVGVESDAVR
jgi:hypothetical protein